LLNYKIEMFTFVKEYYKYFMKWRSTFPEFDITIPPENKKK
jgi:hypothetical protein